jgi:hypothetical protein
MSGFTRGPWVSGGRTSQPSVQWQKSPCVSVQPPAAPFSDLERVRSRSTRCCGSAKREVCSRRAWTAQQGLPLGSATTSRGTHGFLAPARDPSGSSAKATRTWSSGLWKRTGETEARACSIHKVLRLCKAGCLFSPRRDRTTRTPPRECDNKQGDPWVPGASQGPIGFLGTGSAMIHGRAWSPGLRGTTGEPDAGHVRSTSVAVLPGGALLPAPFGPHQQGPPQWECPGSKQGPSSVSGSKEEPPWIPRQGRRDDPQAVFGRLACGERLANPTSASVSIHPLK